MSALVESSIRGWRLGRGPEESASVPVGLREPLPLDHTATLVEVQHDVVVYGREIPCGVYASEVRELPPSVWDSLGLPRMHAWLFSMYKSIDGFQTTDATFTFTALPYTQNRHLVTKLRPLSHAEPQSVERMLEELTRSAGDVDPERRLQTALDGLTSVPFAHDRQRVAAWMAYPRRFDGLGAGRFDRNANYALGVCGNYDQCVERLRIDHAVEDLFEFTTNGRLFEKLPALASGPRRPGARPVDDVVKANKELILDMAITLAMAGPVDADLIDGADRRVIRKVIRIYKEIAYRWSADQPDLRADDYFEHLTLLLRLRGEAASREGLLDQVRTSRSGDTPLLGLLLAYPEDWPLPSEFVTFLDASLPKLRKMSTVRERTRRRLLKALQRPLT